jgi:GMP synthase (glutamine-hydrolysing)
MRIRPTVSVVEHEPGAPLGRMSTWLEDAGLTVDICRPYEGEELPAQGRFDALVVLGSQAGARDDDRAPWLPTLRSLMGATADSGTPLLGICLGAQLLAVAAGGEVRRSDDGPEIGVIRVDLSADAATDDLASALPAPFASFSYHYDQITALPPGAVLLGGTRRFPVQLFRVGRAAWGIQSHPEVDPDAFLSWVAKDPAGLPQEERLQVRMEVVERFRLLRDHGKAVAAAFAAVVQRHADQCAGSR